MLGLRKQIRYTERLQDSDFLRQTFLGLTTASEKRCKIFHKSAV